MISNTLLIIFVFVFIYLLATFRKYLVFEIQSLSLLLVGSNKPGLAFYTIIMLPGTIIHELSHWLIAEVLRVPTGEITIFPEHGALEKQEKQLGSLATAKTDPIRGFLIGMAPLITGTSLLIIMSLLLTQAWESQAPAWQFIVLVYGVIVLGNSMLISKADRRYWPFMAALTVVLYVAFFRSGLAIPQSVMALTTRVLRSINSALIMTLALEFALMILVFAFRKAIEKIRGKKIVRT